jgi:hypothetical protein
MYFFLKNDFINTKNKFPIHIFIDLSNTIYQHVQIMNDLENFHRPLCFFNTPGSYFTHIPFFNYIRRLSLDFCCKSTTIISQNPWSYTYIEEMPLNYFTDLCTKNLTKDNVMRFYEYWNDGLGGIQLLWRVFSLFVRTTSWNCPWYYSHVLSDLLL